ncbi:MAG TPA: bifunctional riboflavin kinase/FAD synthetase [Thermomicrobiaceae bacterium]|nr:bifunctional riboflavin kinase/FAD synthetase [Thermomicrobiaceae bacterium]HEX5396050.1 bifunctional riboflavin kinase/FAD synthetase [Candidatus Limnocylindria bacterium]
MRERSASHVVTIGNFDGVHLGHQFLLRLVIDEAARLHCGSAAITFDPLPPELLRPEAAPPRLTTTDDRVALIAAQGIDTVRLIPFTRELSELSPEAFVQTLAAELQPVEIVVGADFRFGHRRAGTVEVLRELGERYGFQVRVLDRVGDVETDFSSSRVRVALAAGAVEQAAALLGRPYFLRGTVIVGEQRGRLLGFPTANLDIAERLAIPDDGIYAGLARLDDEPRLIPAMIYIGSRPTFDGDERSVEVNLLDFERDIYGHRLAVVFAVRIRGDLHFDSVDNLIKQMNQDRAESIVKLAGLPTWWPGEPLAAILGVVEGAIRGHE